jgi:hypothetical protein
MSARAYTAGWRRTKPTRPYKNLADFVAKHGCGQPRGKYPCLACRGRGTIYDPEDPPCPIEGNRYRREILCTACGSSGQGTREACRQAYKAAIERFHAEAHEYKALVQKRKEALAGLTQEEIQALRELGV